jgi:hypothetical protein
MSRKQNKDIMYSFNGTYCSENDMMSLSLFFENLTLKFAQCEVSELIDLNNYKIKRDTQKIKSLLKGRQEKPFMFINCLN